MKTHEKIKFLRKSKKMTQDEVAALLNMTRSNYNKIENGIIEFREEILKKLSQLFNISVEYLIDEETHKIREKNSKTLEENLCFLQTMINRIVDERMSDILMNLGGVKPIPYSKLDDDWKEFYKTEGVFCAKEYYERGGMSLFSKKDYDKAFKILMGDMSMYYVFVNDAISDELLLSLWKTFREKWENKMYYFSKGEKGSQITRVEANIEDLKIDGFY